MGAAFPRGTGISSVRLLGLNVISCCEKKSIPNIKSALNLGITQAITSGMLMYFCPAFLGSSLYMPIDSHICPNSWIIVPSARHMTGTSSVL